MEWLFVIGVSLELSGAFVLTAPIVLPLLFRQWDKIAGRGYLATRGGLAPDDFEEMSFTLVGILLLMAGFALQLAGYVVQFRDAAIIAAAAAVTIGAAGLGVVIARSPLKSWLYTNADRRDPFKGR